MAYANTTYTYNSGAATPLVYTIPFQFLRDAHVKVKVDLLGTGVYVAETGFTVASNGFSITFAAASTGGTAWTNGTSLIYLYRQTPLGTTERIVDFQSGAVLASSDLDDSALQGLYASQEAADTSEGAMQLTADGGSWDAVSKKVVNQTDPTVPQDGATKAYVDSITAAAGNLPDVSGGGQEGSHIIVESNVWTAKTAAETRTQLDLPNLFLEEANNLSDLPSVGTARSNLGMGSAALINAGEGDADVAVNSATKSLKIRHGALTAGCDFGDSSYAVPYASLGGGAIGLGGRTNPAARLTLLNLVVVNESGDTSPTLEDAGKSLQLPTGGAGLWKVSWGFGVVGSASASCFCYHALTDEDGNALDGGSTLVHARTLPDATTCWDFSRSKIINMATQDQPIKINFRVWLSTEVNLGTFSSSDSYMMVERLPGTPS